MRLLASLGIFASLVAAQTAGPRRGTLIIAGGGELGPEIVRAFIDAAGGLDAPVVVIPTADGAERRPDDYLQKIFLAKAGMRHLALLHTSDRQVANSRRFVEPLRRARGIWFPGGRQWRLADAYLGTRTEREIRGVLERGGVIGGSSAGATIQGSYLVRGAPEGNHIMMSKGHEKGFGFLKHAAIDQHLLVRHREKDLLAVVAAHPDVLGIGIDERTAIVVRGDAFQVVGTSKVAIYDAGYAPRPGGNRYYFLSAGDRFDLKTRRAERASAPAPVTGAALHSSPTRP